LSCWCGCATAMRCDALLCTPTVSCATLTDRWDVTGRALSTALAQARNQTFATRMRRRLASDLEGALGESSLVLQADLCAWCCLTGYTAHITHITHRTHCQQTNSDIPRQAESDLRRRRAANNEPRCETEGNRGPRAVEANHSTTCDRTSAAKARQKMATALSENQAGESGRPREDGVGSAERSSTLGQPK
jgi:hypothetical protein